MLLLLLVRCPHGPGPSYHCCWRDIDCPLSTPRGRAAAGLHTGPLVPHLAVSAPDSTAPAPSTLRGSAREFPSPLLVAASTNAAAALFLSFIVTPATEASLRAADWCWCWCCWSPLGRIPTGHTDRRPSIFSATIGFKNDPQASSLSPSEIALGN